MAFNWAIILQSVQYDQESRQPRLAYVKLICHNYTLVTCLCVSHLKSAHKHTHTREITKSRINALHYLVQQHYHHHSRRHQPLSPPAAAAAAPPHKHQHHHHRHHISGLPHYIAQFSHQRFCGSSFATFSSIDKFRKSNAKIYCTVAHTRAHLWHEFICDWRVACFLRVQEKKKEKNFPFLPPSPQWHFHCYSGADSELLHANINSCSAGVLLALNALSCQVKLTLNAF